MRNTYSFDFGDSVLAKFKFFKVNALMKSLDPCDFVFFERQFFKQLAVIQILDLLYEVVLEYQLP